MKQILEKNTRRPGSGGYGNKDEYAPEKVLSTHDETDPSHNATQINLNPSGGKSSAKGKTKGWMKLKDMSGVK